MADLIWGNSLLSSNPFIKSSKALNFLNRDNRLKFVSTTFNFISTSDDKYLSSSMNLVFYNKTTRNIRNLIYYAKITLIICNN